MKNSILKYAVLGLLAAALVAAPGQALGQGTNKTEKTKKATVEKAEKAGKSGITPFRGKISAVDKTAKTISVGERTFQITSETRIIKAGKPATLDDAAVGEEVGGSYVKAEDGKLMAKMVRIGPKPEPAPGAEKKAEKKPATTEKPQ